MVGPRFIVAFLRGFTPGEDAVMTWVRMQDDSRLIDIVPLKDGRDFVVFQRNYRTETFLDAYKEAERFKATMMRLLPMQHDTRHAEIIV